MIDKSNEIYTILAKRIRKNVENITIMSEYVKTPSKFPCITFEEVSNLPTLLDSAIYNKYAKVQYRVQVFSNKENEKRTECRKIYDEVDKCLQEIGLVCTSYMPRPEIYNSNVYQITAIYSGVIDRKGIIYRN